MKKPVKSLIIVVGSIIGAVVGFKMAKNLIDEMEMNNGKFPLSGSNSIRAGLDAFGVIKRFTGR